MAPLPLRFVRSATRADQLPETPAEVAFVGRSNVGKSSLINALANRRQLAQVSKTPGRTRVLNLFELDGAAGVETGRRPTVVDLPGYGYAAVSAAQKSAWPAMIEGYLQGRSELRCVLVLVDAEVGPTALDLQMLDWLRSFESPHLVVGTKTDKVKPSQRARRQVELAARCGLERDDVTWVSASTGAGIDAMRARVLELLRI